MKTTLKQNHSHRNNNFYVNDVNINFEEILKSNKIRIENFLKEILPNDNEKISIAMQYAVLNGGKRLRPTLTFLTAKVLENTIQDKSKENLEKINNALNTAAASIELIHCYSLVHDDLPALDNDDLRRGKPTCHKKFDEATAILVGDSLLTLAFEILADKNLNPINDHLKIKMISTLAKSVGASGLIKGQMQDLAAENKEISSKELRELHFNKTGKLFITSIHLGIFALSIEDPKIIKNLLKFAELIGVLFQMQDDLLDEIATTETIGKPAGSDKKNLKTTYISKFGINGTKEKILNLKKEIFLLTDNLSNIANLSNLNLLKEIVTYFTNRTF